MENLFMGFGVSGMMLAVVFLIVWVIQSIMKKDKTVSITGLKFSVILFLAGLLLSVGIGFTIVLALIVGILYFTLKKKKASDDSVQNPKRTFWNIPFRSKPKAVAISAAISLCITVWATVDFYRTADTITTDSPSAEVEIEEKAAEEVEQKAAEEAAAEEVEQKAAEEAAAKEAEQKAAEEAAAKEAEQKAAEEAAAKEAEEKAAEEAAAEEQDTEEYVLNTNTRKFHHSWCSSANRIKPGNRSTCIGRDAAIAMGYTSCGQCNP